MAAVPTNTVAVPDVTADRMIPAALELAPAPCADPDRAVGRLCEERCSDQAEIVIPSHHSLTHATAAAPLYEVADMAARTVSRATFLGSAQIRATPPPHSILHCVFLI